VSQAEGNIASAEGPGAPVPPGSGESRACIGRIWRELGRSCFLRPRGAGRGAGWSKPRPAGGSAGRRWERKKQRKDGTGGQVNELPGMDGRKSERLVVPQSPGNRTW